jgi:hypothetical protein
MVFYVERMRFIWPTLEHVCRVHRLPLEVFVAVLLVETAYGAKDRHAQLEPLTKSVRHRLHADDATWMESLEVAAGHLSCQLERFGSLALALVGYHDDPQVLEAATGCLLNDPLWSSYVETVTSTLDWLCRIRPWCRWPESTAARGGWRGRGPEASS